MTDVVILSGGRGTRLHPETETRPKSLLPVGSRPILDHIVGHFLRCGFRRFVLCLGYQSAAIRAHFRARSTGEPSMLSDTAESVQVEDDSGPFTAILADTGLDTSTGGRVKRAAPYIHSDRFLVAYGDVLSDVDLNHLCTFHVERRGLVTVTAVRPTSPFGHLVLDDVEDRDVVRDFREKPQLDDWVNNGYAVLERAVLQRLTVDSPQLEVGLFPEVAAEGRMLAFRHRGFFEPMDSYADYTRLNEMDGSGKLDWIRGPAVTVR